MPSDFHLRHTPAWIIVLIFILALLPRLGGGLALSQKVFYGDERIFLTLADGVRDGFSFRARPFRPPLYAAILAPMTSPDTATSIRNVRIFQSFVGAIAALLLYFLGKELFGHRVGLVAACIYAIYPLALTTSVFLFPQGNLAALLYAIVLVALRARRRGSNWGAFAAGALIGAAVLHVPSSMALVAAMVVWLAFMPTPAVAQRARLAAFVVVGSCIVVLPWTARNYVTTGGEFIPVSANGPVNFWLGNNPSATLTTKSHLQPTGELAQRVKDLSRAERDNILIRESLNWIKQHPGRFLSFTALKFVAFFRPMPGQFKESVGHQRLYSLAMLLTCTPVILLALIGVRPALKHTPDTWLLIAIVLFSAALYSLFFVALRFRAPFDGLLILIGANLIVGWMRRRKRSERNEENDDAASAQ